MRIPKSSVERYRKTLHTVGDQAAQYVANMLALEESSDVATVRESAISAITESIGAQGEIAQALAAQLYDAVCEAEGVQTGPAEIFDSVIDHNLMVEKVHYYARDLVAGMRKKFDKECADLAEYYVRRCAYENTVRNCGANNVRYARIPTGEETCEFCMMLASRGFVYHTEATASGAHGVHRHCDCIVMPGVQGKTVIDGYDPDEWYALWQGASQRKAVGKWPKSVLGSDTGGDAAGMPHKLEDVQFDPEDERQVAKALQWCKNVIRDKPVEHALVMTGDGEIWHSVGDVESVRLDGVPLTDSLIVHNHPEESGGGSFGHDDYVFLQEHSEIRELWAVTKDYDYFVRALKYIDIDYGKAYVSISIDTREDYKHLVMEYMHEQGYIDYQRMSVSPHSRTGGDG